MENGCYLYKTYNIVVTPRDTVQPQPNVCQNDTSYDSQSFVAPYTYQDESGASHTVMGDTTFTVVNVQPHSADRCFTYEYLTIVVSAPTDTTPTDTVQPQPNVCQNDTSYRTIDEIAPYTFLAAGTAYTLYADTVLEYVTPHSADRCYTYNVITIHVAPACQSVATRMFDTACGSYVWRGRTYTASGLYMDTVTFNANAGCDSIFHLYLSIIPSRTSSEQVFGYGSYSLDLGDGTTTIITSDTTVYLSSVSTDGCTNIRELNIRITPVVSEDTMEAQPTIDTVSTCNAYTWHGRTYRTSGVYTDEASNSVLMLTVGNRSIQQFTEVVNGSYTYRGRTYTASTMIFDTLTNVAGCDSIVVINLRVRSVQETSITACDSYTWTDGDGRTYTTSGILFDSASMTRLNLRIRHSSNSPMRSVVNCGNYAWNGVTYYRSGSYRAILENANMDGCDSIDQLNLTIRTAGYTNTRRVECNSYLWHGVNCTATGLYTYVDSTSACESVEILFLTIRNCGNVNAVAPETANRQSLRARKSVLDTTVCDFFVWDVDGQTYTTSGTYQANGETLLLTVNSTAFGNDDTVIYEDTQISWNGLSLNRDTVVASLFADAATNGCDSVATLYLKTVPRIVEDVEACDSYSWYRNGQTYTTSTTVEDFPVTLNLIIKHATSSVAHCEACENYRWENGITYVASTTAPSLVATNADGCDSVITLNLTINHASSGIDERTENGSYTWINGQTYTSDAVAQYTIEDGNAAGCDSLVVLALTIVSGTEGINDVQMNPITIYPNPAVEHINIKGVEVIRAELFNLSGTRVRMTENTASLTVGGLPAGVYMLRITMPQGTAMRRVVKR